MLVIFDCDGVLVDSEDLAAEVFSDVLVKSGMSMSKQRCLDVFQGRTLAFCFSWLEQEFGQPLPDNFKTILDSATENVFAKRLSAVAGVENILQYLQKKSIAFCVASNGGHKKIANSLRVTALDEYFKRNCFSFEDVSKGKPAPDLFLHAANKMGFAFDSSVVIEDSMAGVQAALAAGMQVFAYDPEGKRTWPDGVATLRSMNELQLRF